MASTYSKKTEPKLKIGIIGHVAQGTELNDGQTVKIRMIIKELESKYDLEIVDTYRWKSKVLRIFKEIFKLSKNNKKIILSVAKNGAIVIIPILVINKFLFKNEICYCSIGGWISQFIERHKIFKKFCKKLDKIFVETKETKERLEKQGFKNVEQLYNFKELKKIKKKDITGKRNRDFCIFSRILKEKGIEDAITVITNLNNKGYKLNLDIYGPIDKNYRERFMQIEAKLPCYIKYCGNVKTEESTKILKEYFMLLFPTKYEREGLPGTLIDAYFSGLPVLASDWNSAREFIIENETGYIYEFNNVEDFEKKLMYILEHREKVDKMREKCLDFSEKFAPSRAIQPLLSFIKE